MGVVGALRPSTFQLWQAWARLARLSARLEKQSEQGFWAWWVRARKAHLRRRRQQVAGDLELRYNGLLDQLWTVGRADARATAAGSDPQDETTRRKIVEAGIWQGVLNQSRAPIDASSLPGCFWKTCLERYGQGILPWKRRFMLRPFVDALPQGGDFLRLLAYSPDSQSLPRGRELLRDLERACERLRQVLLDRRETLAAWTDGAITPNDVERLGAPYPALLGWLIPVVCPPEGAPK